MRHNMHRLIIPVLLILFSLLLMPAPQSVQAELGKNPDPNVLRPNLMPPMTEEQTAKAKAKLEKCNRYVQLKNEGNYEAALTQLKEIWPDSKTTVADISESAVKGKNAIPQEELEPMETIPGFATSSKAQQKVVQAWVLIQSFRIMDTKNLPFICLSYLEA